MTVEPGPVGYFDTPARAERLQLVLHLVRNAGEVTYLRAPAGAGKTRFVQRVLDILGDDMATVWLGAAAGPDLLAATADQLGLAAEEALPWPDGVFDALGGVDLLVVADDADHLDLTAVEQLAALLARGAQLLLIGQGGPAQTMRDWDVRFVDLPPFEASESASFLRAQVDEDGRPISDETAAGLHRQAQGLPGLLLDGLAARPGRVPRTTPAEVHADRSGPGLLTWLAGAVLAIVLGSVLLLQDGINTLFETEAPVDPVLPAGEPALLPRTGQPRVYVDSSLASADAEQPSDAPPTPPVPEAGLTDPGPSDTDDSTPAAAPAAPTVDRAVESLIPPMPNLAELIDQGDTAAGAPPADADPLEQVMRDAIAAAEQEQTQAPAPQRPLIESLSTSASAARVVPPGEAASPVRDGDARVPTPVGPTAREDAGGEVPGSASTPGRFADGPASALADADAPAGVHAEVVEPTPRQAAPVDDRSTDAPAAARPGTAAVSPQVASDDRAAPASASPGSATMAAADTDLAWFKRRQPGRYTLQVIGARDLAAVRSFAGEHALPMPHAVFARPLDGRPWYSLVVGDYPDRAAAIAARERLPASLKRSDTWPRTFASIQKLIKN